MTYSAVCYCVQSALSRYFFLCFVRFWRQSFVRLLNFAVLISFSFVLFSPVFTIVFSSLVLKIALHRENCSVLVLTSFLFAIGAATDRLVLWRWLRNKGFRAVPPLCRGLRHRSLMFASFYAFLGPAHMTSFEGLTDGGGCSLHSSCQVGREIIQKAFSSREVVRTVRIWVDKKWRRRWEVLSLSSAVPKRSLLLVRQLFHSFLLSELSLSLAVSPKWGTAIVMANPEKLLHQDNGLRTLTDFDEWWLVR